MKTFWELLSHYSITIPVIQRDYAQGRKHPKIDSIRREFISNILQHLSSVDNNKLELDFIYGAQKEEHLIILDGQQRLTTLFLLHFYIYSLHSEFDQKNLKLFSKFNYETRQSTRDFLASLMRHNVICRSNLNQAVISKRIKNEAWYFSIWDYDPSIQGMLRMLDEIETQLGQEQLNPDALWQQLTTHARISFNFLEMPKFGLTDELYIKMNARGIHLSEFENFKAWLNKNISTEFASSFFSKLDKEWTDFFWALKDKDQQNVDDILYECFKVILSGILALFIRQDSILNKKSQKEKEQDSRRSLIEYFRKTLNKDTEQKQYIDLNLYQQHGLLTTEHCVQIYYFMNFICVLKKRHKDIFDLISKYIFESKKILFLQSYQAYILIFSIFIYTTKKGYHNLEMMEQDLEQNSKQFKDYFNICLRVTINHAYNSLDDYLDSIYSIELWAEKIDFQDVIKSCETLDESQIKLTTGFKNQYREEKRKAKLIQQGWNKTRLDQDAAEPIFHGQVGFLLDWSIDTQGVENEQLYLNYAEKLKHLFSLSLGEANSDQYLMQRALLSCGDYLPIRSSKFTFCAMHLNGDARSHNENWRLVFNQDQKLNEKPFLKNLLDLLPESCTDTDVMNLINKRKELIHDWRRLCIDFPNTITYTKNKLIDKSEQGVFLIHREKRIRYVELRTYCLFLTLRDKSYTVHYQNAIDKTMPLSVQVQINLVKMYIRYEIETNTLVAYTYTQGHDELSLQSISLSEYPDLEKNVTVFSDQYLNKDVYSKKLHAGL